MFASRPRPLWAAALSLAVLLIGCANPSPPSGGPRDTTPPAVVNTNPARDSVNVSADTEVIRIEFSEFVERSTLPGALSITPEFEGRLQFDWSGQSVEVELPASLRDSTTYILTLNTDLTDSRGVALESPITFAFSTGPRIDQGEIRGRVVGPRNGQPQEQVDVFAYATVKTATAEPRPFPERPDYRTQTGSDGRFTFNYLPPQRYFVVAVRDNNRNRRLDPAEPFAVPPHPALPADSAAAAVPVPWLLTRIDTVGPSLQRVQSPSRRRVRLGFSEPVRLGTRSPEAWRLRDSTAGRDVAVQAVYEAAGRREEIVVRTAPMADTRHALPLDSALVTDTLGRGLTPDTARFQPAPRRDTMQTRFQSFRPPGLPRDTTDARLLLPGVQPGVRFNQAPDSTVLRRAVSVRDAAGAPRSYTLDTDDGRGYRVQPTPPLAPDAVAVVQINPDPLARPDTTVQRRFRRVSARRLGGLEGRIRRADTILTTPPRNEDGPGPSTPEPWATAEAVVEARPEESNIPMDLRRLTVEPGSTFVFRQVPEGTFSFRAFLDRNGNGRWDGGQARPYRPAEPIAWSDQTTQSRPRWTTVLPAPLRVPILRLESPAASADTASAGANENE